MRALARDRRLLEWVRRYVRSHDPAAAAEMPSGATRVLFGRSSEPGLRGMRGSRDGSLSPLGSPLSPHSRPSRYSHTATAGEQQQWGSSSSTGRLSPLARSPGPGGAGGGYGRHPRAAMAAGAFGGIGLVGGSGGHGKDGWFGGAPRKCLLLHIDLDMPAQRWGYGKLAHYIIEQLVLSFGLQARAARAHTHTHTRHSHSLSQQPRAISHRVTAWKLSVIVRGPTENRCWRVHRCCWGFSPNVECVGSERADPPSQWGASRTHPPSPPLIPPPQPECHNTSTTCLSM